MGRNVMLFGICHETAVCNQRNYDAVIRGIVLLVSPGLAWMLGELSSFPVNPFVVCTLALVGTVYLLRSVFRCVYSGKKVMKSVNLEHNSVYVDMEKKTVSLQSNFSEESTQLLRDIRVSRRKRENIVMYKIRGLPSEQLVEMFREETTEHEIFWNCKKPAFIMGLSTEEDSDVIEQFDQKMHL